MRAQQLLRKRPRAWDQMGDSIKVWLTDQAWIQREQHFPGTEDGTPNEKLGVFGPYSAKMSAAVPDVFRQPDRFTKESKHTLAIACDVEPTESDTIEVQRFGRRYKCHPMSVYERRAVWGQVVLYSLQVTEFVEF
jgi:hypothetical protein